MEIKLTKGYIATIDDNDFELISKHSWYAKDEGNIVYAISRINYKLVSMHRFLTGANGYRTKVDHIDGNGLNNRRLNLRICTNQQNAMNSVKQRRECKSKYKGVSFDKRRGKYFAYICPNNKTIFLGYYADEKSAAIAYNNSAMSLYGEYAKLNLIQD